MASDPDPRAEKIRRRKEARALRKQIRVQGIIAAAKFFVETRAFVQAPLQEDCPDCLKLQGAA